MGRAARASSKRRSATRAGGAARPFGSSSALAAPANPHPAAGLLPQMPMPGYPHFSRTGSQAIHAFHSVILDRRDGRDLHLGLAVALYRSSTSGGRSDVGLARLADGDYPTPEAFAALSKSSLDPGGAPIIRALDRVGAAAAGADHARRLRHQRVGLLLAIDQMEELFARPDAELAKLRATAGVFLAATGRVWVAGTHCAMKSTELAAPRP